MKIKDRIIKMLGGYTKDDHDFFAKKPVTCIADTRKVERIKSVYTIPTERLNQDSIYRVIAKSELVTDIVRKLNEDGYIYTQWEECEAEGFVKITGTLDVIRRYH